MCYGIPRQSAHVSFVLYSTVRLPDTPTVSGGPVRRGGVSPQHPHAVAGLAAEQVQGVPERGSAAGLQHL